MLFKTTRRLFKGIYQYKIVLTCSNSHAFRSGDMTAAIAKLKRYESTKNKDDTGYGIKLATELMGESDIDVRVESPWISIYTNNRSLIKKLTKINPDHVKYVCEPESGTNLQEGTIIMPKMNYDYRVTLGKTIQEHSVFIAWADTNKKCKLTKSCIRELQRSRSWGGTHFYITGDNNLLLAKMHLGGSISKVERIVKK
jgi:hypothetical protein